MFPLSQVCSLQMRPLLTFVHYPHDYYKSPRCILGCALFAYGWYINYTCDATLRQLRRFSPGYTIPKGGWFDVVSTPHYWGEMLEWLGFAVATGTTSAWVFVLFTAANLIPRGVSHHEWYRATFGEAYPRHRKAVIPFVW
jgi:protein-S-isoprenylcysteine O-methyltransferase Ste14